MLKHFLFVMGLLTYSFLSAQTGIGKSSPTATLTVGIENGTIPGELTLNPTWTSYCQ